MTPVACLVDASCRRPLIVSLAGLALACAAVLYVMHHFALTADTAELISPKLEWRRTSAAFDRAFPQNSDVTAVVIDGATPEIADDAATRLSARLASQPALFTSVRRPESGPFFDKEGLLLLPLPEVQKTIAQLLSAQAFLGPLAADPSLRGVMTTCSTVLTGVQQGQAKLSDLRPANDEPGRCARRTWCDGRPAFFSWRQLFAEAGSDSAHRQLRRFILVKPRLDFGALEPGAKSGETIHADALALGLDTQHGVTVRLTGARAAGGRAVRHPAGPRGADGGGHGARAMLVMLWLAVQVGADHRSPSWPPPSSAW